MHLNGRATPLILAVFLAGVALVFALSGTGFEDQLLLASRYTARASFALFIVTYSASSLERLSPNETTRALVRYRRQWGLGFAFVHSVHLAALGWYNVFIANMPGLQALLGGGLAYGLMFAMAATSNNASMRVMGSWWKRLHTVGIHWLWFIFAFSYFGRLFESDLWHQGAVLFPICLAALGLRVLAWTRRRSPAPQQL